MKDGGNMFNVLIQLHFGANLANNAIISQPPIRRTRYAASKSSFGEGSKQLAGVPDDDTRIGLLESKWKLVRLGIWSFNWGDFATINPTSVGCHPFV
jgi:hypothetical protein